MCGGDEDRATGVSSLTNEEPLVIVKACIDVMREVIQKDCGDGCNSVVREGEAPLRRSGSRSIYEGTLVVKNGDIGHGWGSGHHWGLGAFASRGGNEDVIRVNGNVLVKRGEEEGVEDFLSDSGGSGRHC